MTNIGYGTMLSFARLQVNFHALSQNRKAVAEFVYLFVFDCFLYLYIFEFCIFMCLFFVFLLFFCKKRLSSSLLPFWLFPLAEVTPSVSHYVELPSQHFFVKHTDTIIFIVITRTKLGLAFVCHVFVDIWDPNLNYQNYRLADCFFTFTNLGIKNTDWIEKILSG